MKRDLELVRELLVKFEALSLMDAVNACEIRLEPWSSDEIIYHCFLMEESGLIIGKNASHMQGKNMLVFRLTSFGHDYLDAVRSDTVWNKVKTRAAEQGVSMTLDLAKSLAMTVITQMLGVR